MKPAPHISAFTATWWLLHAIVIACMCVVGVYLGQFLTEIVMEPIPTGDINTEWWFIFRKFIAVAIGATFLAAFIGYVLLIMPGE